MIKKLIPARNFKYVAIILVLLVAGVLVEAWYKSTHSPKRIVTVGTEVSAPKQAKASIPAEKTPVSNNSASTNAGGATDTHGSTPVSNDSSQWTSSASGAITVKSPAPNSTLKNNEVISGSAKVESIHYRLNDNQVGVIAQGVLDVVNGNFSGALRFTSHGTGARLDIFSTDEQGVEYNEVQINVSL
ncbi:MAG: hypothetical protein JWO96_636 [Candidatus Saccharibacteria bacterium]|nr:hypothetical protein [Candidatus Saccharibacteria bacterium]